MDGPLGTAIGKGQLSYRSCMHAHPLAELSVSRHTTRVLILRKERETIQFLSTAHDTRSKAAELIFSMPPGQPSSHPHKHLGQTEYVEVLSGKMRILINRERSLIDAGETLVIPAGKTHTFGNASKDVPLVVRVRFEAAGNIEWYFMQMACAAIRNGGSWKDVPRLEAGVIHWALRKEYRLAYYPYWLQDLCFGSMTLMAKISGAIKNIKPLSLHAAFVR